ncbi:MAG: CDP-glycerol glycerophosphotransferase family protein [Firmicutes bacterium]|nr:CDP-glycerol glycerophosphotransferase family protein [Bacillota bacterium]
MLLSFLRSLVAAPKLLYIDPGTGSMLFTVLLSVIGAAVYSVRVLANKLSIGGAGRKKADKDRVPAAVFSDNKRYWNIFEPVCRELGRRGISVLYLTASEDDPVFSCGLQNVRAEYLGEGNKAYARLNSLSADVLLSTTPGLDVYQWKRSPGVGCCIHIPHAASEVSLYRMFGLDYYDEVLLSGEYQAKDIRALEKLRSLPEKKLVMAGIPYMDEMAARLESAGPAPDHPRTVLLAPSWGKSAVFSLYGGRIIDVLLKTGYHIIVRPHPHSFTAEKELIEKIMAEHPASEQLEWNRDVDNFEVLRRSDILISDFSGVIFDFTLVYDKPVIYTDPSLDLSPYDAWWLDSPLWTYSALPRLGMRLCEDNMEDLKTLIDECLTDPRFAEGRRQVKTETWAYPGEGASRAADAIEERLRGSAGKEGGK